MEKIWYIYTRDTFTETNIRSLMEMKGIHNENFAQYETSKDGKLNMWRANIDDIQAIINGKLSRNLKFTLYRQNENDTILRWELPVKRGEMKFVLPLIAMNKEDKTKYEEDYARIEKISVERSSERVTLLPVWTQLSRMFKKSLDDFEGLRKGFRILYALILKGTFDEIRLYGNRISPGMEKFIDFATILNIPVKAGDPEIEDALRKYQGK